MGFQQREFRGLNKVGLGSLTLTGANETLRAIQPSGISGALAQSFNVTGYSNLAEVWIPCGITYVITTGITVTAAVVTLWKNGAAVTTGGTATLPIAALGANQIFVPLSAWTASAPAAADVWSLKVTTTSTAGVINPIDLWYFTKQVPAINEGVSV